MIEVTVFTAVRDCDSVVLCDQHHHIGGPGGWPSRRRAALRWNCGRGAGEGTNEDARPVAHRTHQRHRQLDAAAGNQSTDSQRGMRCGISALTPRGICFHKRPGEGEPFPAPGRRWPRSHSRPELPAFPPILQTVRPIHSGPAGFTPISPAPRFHSRIAAVSQPTCTSHAVPPSGEQRALQGPR